MSAESEALEARQRLLRQTVLALWEREMNTFDIAKQLNVSERSVDSLIARRVAAKAGQPRPTVEPRESSSC